jgi:uncharacterized protein
VRLRSTSLTARDIVRPDTVLPVDVSASAARRFLVARHLLAPPRSLTGAHDAVLEVFRRLGSIQFDPLSVAGRNHDLVLHGRVADYDPAWCEELLYERRELFEAYNKGLSLLPTSELPWYAVSWSIDPPRVLTESRDLAIRVLERIRAEGPLATLDFEQGEKVDWLWAPTNAVRAVLEAYSFIGVLGLARRDGNRRYYDLVERLFSRDLLTHEVPLEEQLRHKLLSRFRAHGLLGARSTGEVWLGTGYVKRHPSLPARPSRSELRDALLGAGEIVPVRVDGVRGDRFVLRAELDLLEGQPELPPAVTFLAPLDPLVWDRVLLRELFDFDYIWEVYVPEKKRRWGYYVLPVLFRDRLVGRIEPRIDRAGGTVQVLGLWWEEGFAPRREDGFVDAMRAALRDYLRFAGAKRIEWAPHLTAGRRLFLSRP